MKDVATSSSRHARNTVYPKKRPSPHGIQKRAKASPIIASVATASSSRRATPAARAALLAKKQREAQVLALHRDGVLLEEEYREEARCYMHEMELQTLGSVSSMDQQPQIKWHMRPCLVDFLVEVHFTFRLRPETLYLALNILDRYVSRRVVFVKHYQLVGCAALWIAAKFEDAKERVPTVHDLVSICHDAYDESAFVQMEFHVLQTIEWSLGHPTAEAWLRLMCCGFYTEDTKVQHVARFLMEITLFYREFVKYTSSSVALAALLLARFLCGKSRLVYEETEEALEVIGHLDNRLAHHVNDLSEVLVKKYSYAFYSKAATFVVQYYLKGGRYVREDVIPFAIPMTPTRSYNSSVMSTPASASTTASDISEDMPATPTSPFPSDTFSGSYVSDVDYDKENLPQAFEPVMSKMHVEVVPDQFLPHDFVAFGRPALHALNAASPRVASVA